MQRDLPGGGVYDCTKYGAWGQTSRFLLANSLFPPHESSKTAGLGGTVIFIVRARSLRQFEKFLFGQPAAVTVSFRPKKLQEVPQPPDTFIHLHCRPLHVLTLCTLIAFKRKFVKILSNYVSIKFKLFGDRELYDLRKEI